MYRFFRKAKPCFIIQGRRTKVVKTADLQAHNASRSEALCAHRSAVFTRLNPTTLIRIGPKNSVFVFPSVTPRSAVVQLSKKHNTKINNACTLPNINFITFRCVSTSHNPQMFKIFPQILACRRLSCDAIYITNGRQHHSLSASHQGAVG